MVEEMGYDRFECAPGLRLQAHERVSAIHHENLLQRLDRLEEMMERLERRMDRLDANYIVQGLTVKVRYNDFRIVSADQSGEHLDRAVFERLFGEGGTATQRRAALGRRASLLDWIREDIARLRAELGPSDRTKVSEYLDTVREVERRIQKAEVETENNSLPDLDRPIGVPASYADHAKLMFDLQVLAFRGDVTRVVTFQLARESSNRTYPEIGVPDPHHPISHHGNDPEKLAMLAKINQFHVSLFGNFLEQLASVQEGEGSLLDHSLYMYGSGMGNPNVHDHVRLPVVVAGGGAARTKGGRHIKYAEPTPMANLHLTLLDQAGVALETWSDSTGKIDMLLDPVRL